MTKVCLIEACSRPAMPGDDLCAACAARLREPCERCGAPVPEGAARCGCGRKVSKREQERRRRVRSALSDFMRKRR